MIDLRDNVGRYVSITWRHMVTYMTRRMEHLQIGIGQYPYLFSLYLEDGQSQQKLSDRMLVDKSATVRAINKLEELGYVERRADTLDKRSYGIYLTKKAWEMKPQLEAIVEEVQEILMKDLTEPEEIMLKTIFKKMSSNIINATLSSNLE